MVSSSVSVFPALAASAVLPDGVATALVESMSAQGSGKKLVTSGGRLLDTDEVAEAVLGLVGSRRVLRTMPTWRGALMRSGALAPSLAAPAMAVLEKQGERRLRR